MQQDEHPSPTALRNQQSESGVEPANDHRRLLLKTGFAAIGALSVGSATLASAEDNDQSERSRLSTGDAAILRFLAAAEIIETDLWQQYNELGGVNGGS